MSTTQIPPGTPSPPTQPDGGDLYDAGRWESAYLELHNAPALLIQLQDDLSRSRQREAFWISVVVHLSIVILIVNSQRLGKFFPAHIVDLSANEKIQQRNLTYLELPPDEQKISKPTDTNVISDKNRVATSRTPQLDRKELKKILDSSRPAAPGMPQPTAPPQQQAPQQQLQQPTTAQTSPEPQPTPAPPVTNQAAQLQTPPQAAPKPSFGNQNLSAGSAIAQAARAAAAQRGGFGGDGGDYGLGQGKKGTGAIGPMDVLSDTMGVDFGPYLARVLHDVKQNWYNLIPEAARAPLMKKGKVSIEFVILKDGKVAGMTLAGSSGDVPLDRAAWGGITGSNPFPPLPAEFGGQYLALRFHFFYNPDKTDLQ